MMGQIFKFPKKRKRKGRAIATDTHTHTPLQTSTLSILQVEEWFNDSSYRNLIQLCIHHRCFHGILVVGDTGVLTLLPR